MFEDEYGNKFSTCVCCESVYLLNNSDSSFKESFCSGRCEDEYRQFTEDLYMD